MKAWAIMQTALACFWFGQALSGADSLFYGATAFSVFSALLATYVDTRDRR